MSDIVFKPMTVKDILALPPETGEQAFRRGYRDGYVAALYAVSGDQGIPKPLWDFWQNILLDWVKRASDKPQFEIAPQFVRKPRPANGTPFLRWLRQQEGRDDSIGDLARDLRLDLRPKPRGLASLQAWECFFD